MLGLGMAAGLVSSTGDACSRARQLAGVRLVRLLLCAARAPLGLLHGRLQAAMRLVRQRSPLAAHRMLLLRMLPGKWRKLQHPLLLHMRLQLRLLAPT